MLQSALIFSAGWMEDGGKKRERSRCVFVEKRENDYIEKMNQITITNEREIHNIYKVLKCMASMLTKLYDNTMIHC